MLNHIYQMLLLVPSQGENGERYFSFPIDVKVGRFQTFSVWGACPAPDGTVLVMDTEQQWHTLEEKDSDAPVIEALFQKVRYQVSQLQTKKEASPF